MRSNVLVKLVVNLDRVAKDQHRLNALEQSANWSWWRGQVWFGKKDCEKRQVGKNQAIKPRSKLQLDVCCYNQWWRRLMNAYEVETGMV